MREKCEKVYCVYILTNKLRGVLYTGVTGNLLKRIEEHREGVYSGFSRRYNLKKLVYYESMDRVEDAISLEKKIKKWRREWKINLIEAQNPLWEDLYEGLWS